MPHQDFVRAVCCFWNPMRTLERSTVERLSCSERTEDYWVLTDTSCWSSVMAFVLASAADLLPGWMMWNSRTMSPASFTLHTTRHYIINRYRDHRQIKLDNNTSPVTNWQTSQSITVSIVDFDELAWRLNGTVSSGEMTNTKTRKSTFRVKTTNAIFKCDQPFVLLIATSAVYGQLMHNWKHE